VDPFAIANRPRDLDEPLPWDHIDCGVSKQFLKREYQKAQQVKGTPDCHVGPCSNCGEICVPNWRTWAQEIGMIEIAPSAERREPRGATGQLVDPSIGPDQSTNRPIDESTRRGPAPAVQPLQKIRFEVQKVGELRYLSHLELMRALQRALRRAGVPLAYTQGFNPQPKVSVAQALAVGVEGLRELGEVELTSRVEPADVQARWNAQLPPELKILRTWEAPLHGPSLSAGVRGAAYQVRLLPNGWDPTTLAAPAMPGPAPSSWRRVPSPSRCPRRARRWSSTPAHSSRNSPPRRRTGAPSGTSPSGPAWGAA
jgi:hypothetical protein